MSPPLHRTGLHTRTSCIRHAVHLLMLALVTNFYLTSAFTITTTQPGQEEDRHPKAEETTVTAARIYSGQLAGNPGEEAALAFDNFPHTGLSKTYCMDKQVADSACSATAYLSGVKGTMGTIGVTGPSPARPVQRSIQKHPPSPYSSGHRGPANQPASSPPPGTFAHTADRDWESDQDVTTDNQDPSKCTDIASQLILDVPGKNINVILGGGRREFLPTTWSDVEGSAGRRQDGQDLVKKWAEDKAVRKVNYTFVQDRISLLNVDTNQTDFLLGLFASSHMEYHLGADPAKQPTLEEMTRVAIKILSKNPKGYFLFVEGGRIDHGHHDTLARRALDETIEFSKAVGASDELSYEEDTLMVVTSDHAHTMSFSGYPNRGNNILSVAGVSDVDNIPYATLNYANGPGYRKPNGDLRYNILTDNMNDVKYHFPSGVPTVTETHGGEDVGVYAKGPWSHLMVGVMEQNYIPMAIMYAACLGPHVTHCNHTTTPPPTTDSPLHT